MHKHTQNLKRPNNKGQVAIFVALIFQIIFVLFALLVNVGLLVHHKINLQQSTDLAAYYGAMKQAEMMNVVGHVNFQMRQAWKLLAWRYRILGSFGVENRTQVGPPNPGQIDFNLPVFTNAAGVNVNPLMNTKCPAPFEVTFAEAPFMCVGHSNYADWEVSTNNTNQRDPNYCRAGCDNLSGTVNTIKNMDSINDNSPTTAQVISTVNSSFQALNATLKEACENTGPASLYMFAKYYSSYLVETKNRMKFMKILLNNLSAEESTILDLDGKPIKDGVEKTLKNNLTEANLASQPKIDTMNSLSPNYGSECHYEFEQSNKPNQNPVTKLFNELNFQFLQYFIMRCSVTGNVSIYSSGGNDFKIRPIYDANSGIDPELQSQIKAGLTELKSIITQNNYHHTIGIEKNPWCPAYYGVKASSEPIIPFLPIGKVKLNAISFAKPFGGSMGPRYYPNWPAGSDRSIQSAKKVDAVLPNLKIDTSGDPSSIKHTMNYTINYSNYVGDQLGLADPAIMAIYHDMLLGREVGNPSSNQQPISLNKNVEPRRRPQFNRPQLWPAFSEWANVSTADGTEPTYNPLAYDTTNNKNSFMRDIELSVVAPNAFDITYYAIEPDFYNVYLKRLTPEVMQKLAALSGTTAPPLPYDFGHAKNISGIGNGTTDAEAFSVRNQLEVVQRVMRGFSTYSSGAVTLSSPPHANNISLVMDKYFTYIPSKQSSLLTSWTMKDFIEDNYGMVTDDETTMPFGKCLDDDSVPALKEYKSITNSGVVNEAPATPGNCISGGRTGYSVKITNSNSFRLAQPGGGNIINTPDSFLSFPQ